jgi:hypothetical protein
MDSEETLVDRNRDDSATIFFDHDDMRQTNLFSRDHRPFYRVTSDKSFTRTSIFRASDANPLVVLEQRGIMPDRITFSGQEVRPLKTWLKFSGSSLLCVP